MTPRRRGMRPSPSAVVGVVVTGVVDAVAAGGLAVGVERQPSPRCLYEVSCRRHAHKLHYCTVVSAARVLQPNAQALGQRLQGIHMPDTPPRGPGRPPKPMPERIPDSLQNVIASIVKQRPPAERETINRPA